MIQINLLPPEYRRPGTAPPRTLALLLVASLVSFGSLGALGYLFFNVHAKAKNKVEIAQDELNNLAPQAKYADALEKEQADFSKRNKTITEIADSRILWTRKLDRLSAIVNQDKTTGRHQVWFKSLDVDSRVDSASGGVKLAGFSATANFSNVSNFREDLERDEVFTEGFVEFTPPKMRREDREEDLEPPEKVSFDFQVRLPDKSRKVAARK